MHQVPAQRQLIERHLVRLTGELKNHLEKKEAAGTPPGDWDAGNSHFCDPRFTVLTLVLAGTILKSSLQPNSTRGWLWPLICLQQSQDTSLITSHTGGLPYPAVHLKQPHEARFCSKPDQSPGPHTSGPAVVSPSTTEVCTHPFWGRFSFQMKKNVITHLPCAKPSSKQCKYKFIVSSYNSMMYILLLSSFFIILILCMRKLIRRQVK